MNLKKFTVRLCYRTHIDVEVYAEEHTTSHDILTKASLLAAADDKEGEILSNCEEDGNTSIINVSEIFQTKSECYSALCDCVDHAGGYLLFKETNRPRVKPEGDECEPPIKIKALFMSNDDSSPLKFICEIDECWDADDYFCKEDLELVYATIKKLI